MADDDELLRVQRAAPSAGTTSRRSDVVDGSHDEGGRRQNRKRRPSDYFHALAKAAEEANRKLRERGVPYGFCVYREGDRIMVDLVKYNAAGTVVETLRRDITDEDFDRMIEDIAGAEGLFVDSQA